MTQRYEPGDWIDPDESPEQIREILARQGRTATFREFLGRLLVAARYDVADDGKGNFKIASPHDKSLLVDLQVRTAHPTGKESQ